MKQYNTLTMTEVSKRTGAKQVFTTTYSTKAAAIKAMAESKSRLMHPPVPSEMHRTWKVTK
jgi:hypothetical protein